MNPNPRIFLSRLLFAGLLASATPLLNGFAFADETKFDARAKERELINVLQSNAPVGDKAIPCKELAIYGTEQAVPALAPLLHNEDLASWARIALEAIPGSAPDQALREALKSSLSTKGVESKIPRLQGKLLVGVINSIGMRRDPKAVPNLIASLENSDLSVSMAAADSLGRIGGAKAARELKSHLATGPTELRTAAASGCILCAERFMNEGKRSDAVKYYDAVRAAELPRQRILEATRGSILARGADGLPLLLAQIRSSDKSFLNIGLSTARELPGRGITTALVAEFQKTPTDRQPMLLLALSDRNDPTAQPVILDSARTGPKQVRLTAIGILDRSGQPAALPVLLEVATGNDQDLVRASKAALGRLGGSAVDNDIIARLSHTDAKTRPVLIELIGNRAIESALPSLVEYSQSNETPTRNAAIAALGTLGGDRESAALVKLLEASPKPESGDPASQALITIASRRGSASAPVVMPLMQSQKPALRLIALHTLAAAGGPESLKALTAATHDNDESVGDEAVRTLCTWPNTWPEDNLVTDPLLELARSAPKPAFQVLAIRGYMQFLLGDDKLKSEDKLSLLKQALPLLKSPDQKRQAIAVLRQISQPDAVELLANFAADPEISEDASTALLELGTPAKSKLSKDSRRKALETAMAKTSNDSTKQKAESALKKLN